MTAAHPPHDPRPAGGAYSSLREEIRRARRFLFAREAERAGLPVAVALVALAAVALVVALVAPLYRPQFALLRTLLLLASAAFVALGLARMWRVRRREEDAALEAGRLAGGRGDELLSALELGRELAVARDAAAAEDRAGPAHTSDELRASAVRAAAERARALPLARLRLWRGRGRWLAGAGIALLALAAVGAAGGRRTPGVVQHIVLPASAPAPPIRLRVEPGNREVESGASLRIAVFVSGTNARPKLLATERAAARGPEAAGGSAGAAGGPGAAGAPAADRWRETKLRDAGDDLEPRAGERAYSVVLPNLKEDLVYRVEAGGARTGSYEIRVIDLPRATGFRVRYEYPAYTGLKPEESQGVTGDLAAPRGSRARVTITTNRNVASATALFEEGGTAAGETGERLAAFTLPVRADGRYHVRLVDTRGRSVDLGPYEIRAIPDRPPTISVLAPAEIEDLPPDMETTIIAGATDDYGVKRMLLRFRVRETPERIVELHQEREPARELAIRYTWPLAAFSLLPGEEVEYAVGAADANGVDGPQTTWSGARRIRFPSAAEILASMEAKHDETVSSLEDAAEQARDLQRKAEELARDIGRTRDVPWEKRQEIQKALEGQQALHGEIDRITQQLSQDADKLSQSRELNAELVRKLTEMHQLLSQLRDQSLRRSIDQLKQALEKMSPQEIQRALEQFKVSQEEMLRNLERTIEMLKQVRIEEQMEEVSERAAEMERRQIALNDSLGRTSRPDAVRGLEPNEAGIERMSAETQAALDSLAASLREMDPETAEQVEQLGQELGPTGAEQDFEQARQQMKQGSRSGAQPPAERLQKRLTRMRENVDRMRSDFQQKKKNELAQKMEAAAADLLEIADAQEKLLKDPQSTTAKRAEAQEGLRETTERATNRVGDIAKQTLFITPDISAALGRALVNQENAVGRFSDGDLPGGLLSGKEATIAVNQAAAGLMKSMESMGSSSSSTGFKEAMQSLQGLGQQQGSLNQESQGMAEQMGQQGRLVPDPGGALGRLAAEQEAIRQGLREAMQKMGAQGTQAGQNPLGRLGDVDEEMKKVVDELRSGRLDQQTLDRQQKILSRLLDAPRAVEKRDFSRRRTSRPGVEVARSSPGALSPELLRQRPSLAALLARGGRDPVSPRYRALVEEYFQALLAGKAR
jgi:hypothetical protein